MSIMKNKCLEKENMNRRHLELERNNLKNDNSAMEKSEEISNSVKETSGNDNYEKGTSDEKTIPKNKI